MLLVFGPRRWKRKSLLPRRTTALHIAVQCFVIAGLKNFVSRGSAHVLQPERGLRYGCLCQKPSNSKHCIDRSKVQERPAKSTISIFFNSRLDK